MSRGNMLPTPKTPNFTTNVDGRNITYYSLTKADEKALLYASQVDDRLTRIGAISEIVRKCTKEVVKPETDPRWLTEFIFILIRAQSIDSLIEVAIADDDGPKKLSIDLTTSEIVKPEVPFSKKIDLSEFFQEKTVVEFREPTIWDYGVKSKDKIQKEVELIGNAIVALHFGDTTTTKTDISNDELYEWLIELPSAAYKIIEDNFKNINTVRCEMTYNNEKGSLTDLLDFFILKR